MTPIELEKFKNTLAAWQSELEGLIRNREAATIETSADALDQIQHAVERELALGTLARESACLREARAALRRIDEGIFGICLDCEEDIKLKRLAALPWAARCIACQERGDLPRRRGRKRSRSAASRSRLTEGVDVRRSYDHRRLTIEAPFLWFALHRQIQPNRFNGSRNRCDTCP